MAIEADQRFTLADWSIVSANWDVDGLLAKKSEIVNKNLLKWRIAV